jgi:hypothetical protein
MWAVPRDWSQRTDYDGILNEGRFSGWGDNGASAQDVPMLSVFHLNVLTGRAPSSHAVAGRQTSDWQLMKVIQGYN